MCALTATAPSRRSCIWPEQIADSEVRAARRADQKKLLLLAKHESLRRYTQQNELTVSAPMGVTPDVPTFLSDEALEARVRRQVNNAVVGMAPTPRCGPLSSSNRDSLDGLGPFALNPCMRGVNPKAFPSHPNLL